MSQRTRYFLIGSCLVLTIGLGTGLVAYYNGALPMNRAASGPAELAYVPASVAAVAFADVHAIMTSEFRQKLRQVLPSGEAKDQLLAETGIDIERDIDTVVAGFGSSASGVSPEKGAIVLVRGRFNSPMIEMQAVNHGATVDTYRQVRMVTFRDGQSLTGEAPNAAVNQASGGIAFLEPDLLGLGSADALKRAVDTAADHQDVTKNADMLKFITENYGLTNAWVVGRFDALSQTAQLPAQVQSHIPPIEWFSVAVNVNGGVTGVLRADARDDQAAEQLRDAVRGGLAMARLVSGNDPKIGKLMDGVQLQGSGKTVSVGFTVPPDLLDMINGAAAAGKLFNQHDPNQPHQLEKKLIQK